MGHAELSAVTQRPDARVSAGILVATWLAEMGAIVTHARWLEWTSMVGLVA
ncbi:MAG: hypothetical protein JSR18_06645, partial [Proteobacteria bacterium]|nr:hypothetical protein [Pseudomonadota bacterium]